MGQNVKSAESMTLPLYFAIGSYIITVACKGHAIT